MNRNMVSPGVYVTALPGEKFKRCRISVHMALPGERETATALAVLPHLLCRCCEAIPDPLQLSRRLFELYGAEVNGESYQVGASRMVSLRISGVKPAFALADEDLQAEYISLLCELLFSPKLEGAAFSAADFVVEQEKQADFLKSEMNEKRSYCLRQARRKLFGDSPHGLESAGYLDDIAGLTPDFVYECYRALLQTAQVEIMVTGLDAGQVGAAIAARFGGVEGRAPEAPLRADPIVPSAAMEIATEAMDTVQGKLCILCPSGILPDEKDAAALRVASAVLGQLPTSRFFMNVREKKSLCYYCVCSYSASTGVLCIDSGIDHENITKAAEALLHELRVMQQDLITEEELAQAKSALQNSFTAALRDNMAALEGWYLNQQLLGFTPEPDEAERLTAAVTCEEVRDALAVFAPALEYVLTRKEGTQ